MNTGFGKQEIPASILAVLKPQVGRPLQFWANGMSREGSGISGWWDGREFWSRDLADRYGVGEVRSWKHAESTSVEPLPTQVAAWVAAMGHLKKSSTVSA